MDATPLSVLTLVGLLIFNGAPLVTGILAARSNARFGQGSTADAVFWGLTGSYLGWIGLLGLFLINTVSHPQPEASVRFPR